MLQGILIKSNITYTRLRVTAFPHAFYIGAT